jgi:Gram-negative bacterial TonB protein C-terminal
MNPVPVAAERNTKTAVAASRSLRLQTLAGAIAFFSNMRRLVFLLVFGFALKGSAEDLPVYRPALIGKSPEAIINRIDEKLLLHAGQKDAAVMFYAIVEKTGAVKLSGTYRGTPDSKLLEQEVLRALTNAKMIPAVRDHQPIAVFYYGTVLFEVIDNKPRLRIFGNQEESELKKENDFVGPQPCVGGDSKFTGLHYPSARQAPLPVDGSVALWLKIDASGNLQEEKVAKESPPLLGFGDAALDDFANAKFVPAFRDGRPVPCEITLSLYYQPER